MGCINATPVLPNIQINEHGFPMEETTHTSQDISAVSYSQRRMSTKVGNQINTGLLNIYYRENNKNNKMAKYSRKKPKRSRQSGRLTPSRMDFDNVSVSSVASINSISMSVGSLDLSAITDTHHRHWNFPRWGHYKKCSFCGCESHPSPEHRSTTFGKRKAASARGLSGTLRKQNNQKLPTKDSESGGRCATAFANLLAMVRCFFFVNTFFCVVLLFRFLM